MDHAFVVSLGKQVVITTLAVSAPMLIAGLVSGVAITIFQSVTQLKDMTLTFVPKIVAVSVTIIFFLPWMTRIMVGFTTNLFLNIENLIK